MAKKRRGNGQGTLFKRNGRGSWIGSWYDHNHKRREISTHTTDKAAAERILAKRVTDASLRREGVIDPRTESICKQSLRPIGEQLEEWQAARDAKGVTAKQNRLVAGRTCHIVDKCGFTALADIQPTSINRFIRQMQEEGAAPRTINGYIRSLKQFISWAIAEGRLTVNPLASIGMVKVIGQTRTRRPLSSDELAWLVDVTERSPAYRQLDGFDRAVLYRMATGTGFRAGELSSLTPPSFKLDGKLPSVLVRAAYSKRRRDDLQPIRSDLADLLRPWLADKPSDAPVFDLPEKLVPMLRADLSRARARWIKATPDRVERRKRCQSDFLAYQDSEARVVDFHALRMTYITLLVKAGVSVKEAQELARHSDPKLTMNTYTKLGVHDLAGALEKLPPLCPQSPDRNELRATGTDDMTRLPVDTPQQYSQQCAREAVRPGATTGDEEAGGSLPFDDRKSLVVGGKDPAMRRDAESCEKATGEIRTPNLRFTKPLLCR